MLNCQDLSYNIFNQSIFSDISFNLLQGQHKLIIGPSGCGKTSLLFIIAGLVKASSGKVTILNQEIEKLSLHEKDNFRGQNIGMFLQGNHLLNAFNVYDNLKIPMELIAGKEDKEQIDYFLNKLNLYSKKNKKASYLSEGERQRLSLARAFLNKPKLILCDEPSSALDDHNTEIIINFIEEECKKLNISLLLATHDARLKKHFNNNDIISL